MYDRFRVACCTRCEVNKHRLIYGGVNAFETAGGGFDLRSKINRALICSVCYKYCFEQWIKLARFHDLICGIGLRSADCGSYMCRLNTVNYILCREHMRCRNKNRSYFMKCGGDIPVFVISFENYKHFVTFFYAVGKKYICRTVAQIFNIGKGKCFFVSVRITPYDSSVIRCKLCHFIHNVIAKIVIIGINE